MVRVCTYKFFNVSKANEDVLFTDFIFQQNIDEGFHFANTITLLGITTCIY